MRVSLNWLLEVAGLDPGTDPAEVARRLTAAGLEVESVEQVGYDIEGVVVAEVTAIEELTGFKKPVRYCQVNDGSGEPRGVVCGAVNFSDGDRVPLARPGARLPGGFEISARKTYGHISEGMICSADELGLGDDHSGILVLPPDAPLGADFVQYAGLADHVLDIAVTPDRGYALSVRGVSRELATSYRVRFTDPADADLPADVAAVSDQVHAASIEDPTACRPVRAPRGARLRPGGAHAAADAGPAGPVRPAHRVPGRGHHQLPDARAGPAAARVRCRPAQRAHRGPQGQARREAGNPRPRAARPRPG